ncbi:hypothetical protein GCM10022199_26850 [Marihabitans asiaticum]|uniref:Polysaccharide pyruvyl transferase n=1 Tax=Marihabitans asiaticum TaxID=415218 RepID=A0A560WCT6_9MICO|nr:polysaccharide pyruvyl transferase [Marihabitans asiaticum]
MSARERVDSRWPYDSPSRRRARAARRLVDATARSRSVSPRILPAYWWDGHPNFGDALTPWILARYGIAAVHTSPRVARMSGVGSIVEQLPATFNGVIWGSGLLRGEPVDLPQARVLAVRGPLTKAALGVADDVALGDPGILVARHATRRRARWGLGIVPHGFHRRDEALRDVSTSRGVTVVDVARGPGAVIGHIAECSAILSTSLHGLIIADGLGIPAAWAQRRPALWGGDFKFRDYEAVMTPGRTREIHLTQGTGVRDIELGVAGPDGDAREEAIRSLEETIPLLPTTTERVWRSFALRGVPE